MHENQHHAVGNSRKAGAALALALLSFPLVARYVSPQEQALVRLRADSASAVEIRMRGAVPRSVMGRVVVPSGSAIERARSFLDEYGELFLMADGSNELHSRGAVLIDRDDDTRAAVFEQRLHGLPVFASSLVVTTDQPDRTARFRWAFGTLAEPREIETEPTIPPDEAAAIARTFLGSPTAAVIGSTELMIFDGDVVGLEAAQHLVWRVTLGSLASRHQVLVDANTSEVVFDHAYEKSGGPLDDFELDLEHVNHTGGPGSSPSGMVLTNCYNPTTVDDWIGDEDGVDSPYNCSSCDGAKAWKYFRETYLYYHETHGRDSFDDDDGEIVAYVYSGADNAFANASCGFEFGFEWVGRDLVGHEFTHMVNAFSLSNLIYKNQSGAIDESLADTFGEFIDPGEDWLIGEDIGIPLRSMIDPPEYGDPDHMDDYVHTSSDNGGVHTNSGILNKAHYLLSAGAGQSRIEKLLYWALILLPSGSDFETLRGFGIVMAKAWAEDGKYGFNDVVVCAVRNAYGLVGVGLVDGNCDGVEDGWQDVDDDGWFDPIDNCPFVFNPQQEDFDNDDIGDVCDNDDDEDGVADTADNCPTVYNPQQKNYDDDSLGNACDSDDDNDGVVDEDDNCVFDYNPDQFDGNSNGYGDACDPDHDGDGFYIESDNCVFVPNPSQADTDGDGIGNACDACPLVYDYVIAYTLGYPERGIPPKPYQPDSDGDGIPDLCDPTPYISIGGILLDGDPLDVRQPLGSTGSTLQMEMTGGVVGGVFTMPLAVCESDESTRIAATERYELELPALPATVATFVTDENGFKVAGQPPNRLPSPGAGLRFAPDCSKDYFLNFEFLPGYAGSASTTFQRGVADGAVRNPWTRTEPRSDREPPDEIIDTDDDGVPDDTDNCPTEANPRQEDGDFDGIGETCDLCWGANALGDFDGDGICADLDCDDTDPLDGSPLCQSSLFRNGFDTGNFLLWSEWSPSGR